MLPADTFRPGPTSGQLINAENGRQPPFINQQPVQGFSALLPGDSGRFFVLSDNGFGKRGNSADYILSIYRIVPDFRTTDGGSGNIGIEQIIQLSDPQSYLPYPTSRDNDRLLTGADLDPESFCRAVDGGFWVGEEFNPSLLHFDINGLLLAPPHMLTGLSSVENPGGKPPTLPLSRGFEGMACSTDGGKLYPMLEGALQGAAPGLNIYTFDLQQEQYLNSHATRPSFRYRLDEGATAIGDFTLYTDSAGLVIERDSKQGRQAALKKVYQVDFEQLDADGFLLKTLVADLLDINDPNDLNRDGNQQFRFPFWTIEGIAVIDRVTLAIVNDNNYPLGQARDDSGTQPDNTEFILIEVGPLWD